MCWQIHFTFEGCLQCSGMHSEQNQGQLFARAAESVLQMAVSKLTAGRCPAWLAQEGSATACQGTAAAGVTSSTPAQYQQHACLCPANNYQQQRRAAHSCASGCPFIATAPAAFSRCISSAHCCLTGYISSAHSFRDQQHGSQSCSAGSHQAGSDSHAEALQQLGQHHQQCQGRVLQCSSDPQISAPSQRMCCKCPQY